MVIRWLGVGRKGARGKEIKIYTLAVIKIVMGLQSTTQGI